jgi:Animal haem peroxidase
MRRLGYWSAIFLSLSLVSCDRKSELVLSPLSCAEKATDQIRPLAETRDARFQGKVTEKTALCRGDLKAAERRSLPWVDWRNYFAAGDETSKSALYPRNFRGVGGALVDLEYERAELIEFNLFDNSGTFEQYLNGRGNEAGPVLRTWPEMRLPENDPNYAAVGGAAAQQLCKGDLIRFRTLNGECNDLTNPLMGSAGTVFARNVEFESTFPDLQIDAAGHNRDRTMNRQGGRLALLTPDPQVISRRLFTREQSDPGACNEGYGKSDGSKESHCDYKKAPFFNVLAAFWIQFMTHDWFSHLEEGHNSTQYMNVGCVSEKVNGVETPLTPVQVAQLGCRPGDAMDKSYVAEGDPPASFKSGGDSHYARAPRTFHNNNTAWWDASQIYGYDATSLIRVKRDPHDPARFLMLPLAGKTSPGDRQGYLPILSDADPKNPDWKGQEAVAFPDNWTIGLSVLHNVFAREHNQFVDEFRRRTVKMPDADSGLRNPDDPKRVIRYRDVTPEELFQVARLVIAAEIAKIHTIEWTTQLLYDEPLYRGMNGNWNGVLTKNSLASRELAQIVTRLKNSNHALEKNQYFSILAAGPGIFGLGSNDPHWRMDGDENLIKYVNGGTNLFGSAFNFPEEFVSVYRLHPLIPDLIDYRQLGDANKIAGEIPVVDTFRGNATEFMHDRGLGNLALSMGRQRLGVLALQNHPRFMQNLKMDRLQTPTKTIDIAALDIIRDRERGVPRFNEFRRQYGLHQLRSFDDFINKDDSPADQIDEAKLAATLREVYGQHQCDSAKLITDAQRNDDGTPIDDCLGFDNGTKVDNIEDLDTVVGYLAESTRPHGYAISETQFVVFILNASRRLYSDRFFTSSFRPEFYSQLGVDWVNNNGPYAECETFPINGHKNEPVSPFKRVLLRTMPELAPELVGVADVFDPWARDRGKYYSLDWKPRPGAESDPAFAGQ